ncbi:MAG TPA: hypothetical protein VNW92_06745 [Polyangiaceae bacterium]|nr:hypothetical protein [Polyangiaceae bacterium]
MDPSLSIRQARRARPSASFATALLAAAACALLSPPAHATGTQGDVIQTDTIGVSLFTYDLDAKSTKTIADFVNLSEFVGLHAYVVDRVRVGMNLQFSERLWPDLPPGKSRFQRFALLPQVGWNFYDPFFTALVFGVAPRTDGRQHVNLTVQGVLGVGFPLSSRVRFSVAGEVPWTYYDKHTLGFTALTGIGIRL